MKRTAPRRSDPEKIRAWQRRSKRLNPRSTKTAAKAGARREAVAAVLSRDGYRCVAERSWPETACYGPLTAHEPLPRSRGGDPCDPDQAVTLCAAHHAAVHAHPALAKTRGLTL